MHGTHPQLVAVRAKRAQQHHVFREIDPPKTHARLPINRAATWHTWSEPFAEFLHQARGELRRLGKPRISRVQGLSAYDKTFSWSPARWTDHQLRDRFAAFVRSLEATEPGDKIMLFDGLLGPHLNSKGLHALFALLRGALVSLAADPQAALYAPLGDVGKNEGDFPLHADLYVPNKLFNVLDNVSGGGASIFFPATTLRRIIPTVASLPERQGRAIARLLEKEPRDDRFRALYELLHGSHRWVKELEREMARRQFRIQFNTGQGYLLHDRKWLHGREAPNGGVTSDRLRRLVFGGVPGGMQRAVG